jgi:uncharacterized protein with PQ loop repeat
MTTIVNTPPTVSAPTQENNNSILPIFLVILLIAFIIFLYYALGALRSGISNTKPNVQVPSKIDVNVNKGQ